MFEWHSTSSLKFIWMYNAHMRNKREPQRAGRWSWWHCLQWNITGYYSSKCTWSLDRYHSNPASLHHHRGKRLRVNGRQLRTPARNNNKFALVSPVVWESVRSHSGRQIGPLHTMECLWRLHDGDMQDQEDRETGAFLTKYLEALFNIADRIRDTGAEYQQAGLSSQTLVNFRTSSKLEL